MNLRGRIIFVNGITMVRVIGTFAMPFICHKLPPLWSVIYIICLLLTDFFDGFLARKLKVCTVFGSLLDQAADKLFGIACLAFLATRHWIMLLPIATETIITLITTKGGFSGGSVDSSILGKIKTFLLALIIIAGFATFYANEILAAMPLLGGLEVHLTNLFNYLLNDTVQVMNSLAFAAVGTGIMVACDYALRAANEIKKHKETGMVPEEYTLKKGKELYEALFSPEFYQKTKKEPLMKKVGIIQKPKRKPKKT